MDDHRRARMKSWRWVGWLVTIVALGFIAKWLVGVDRTIWHQLTKLRLTWLVGSLAVFQLWFYLRFIAWEVIVNRHGSEAQRHVTLRTWTVSELLRYVPGNVWSFAAKYRTSREAGVDRSGAAQSLVIEAVGQVTGASIIGLLFLNAAQWWWAAIGVLAVMPVFLPYGIGGLGKVLRWSTVPKIQLFESLGLILWYMVVWLVFGIATAMIYRSFNNVPWVSLPELIGCNVMAWFVGYMSLITPMGLGVREVSFVALASHAMTNAIASVVALITRLWFVVSELIFLSLVVAWSMVKSRQS